MFRHLSMLLAAFAIIACSGHAQAPPSTAHRHQIALVQGARPMTLDWRRVKPEGAPCNDTSGSPADVKQRAMAQNCSTVLVDRNRQIVFFANWTTVGDAGAVGGASLTAPEVVENIRREFGSKFIAEGSGGTSQRRKQTPAILHYSRDAACEDIIEDVDIAVIEQSGQQRVSALMADPLRGGKSPIESLKSSGKLPWVELLAVTDQQLATEPFAQVVAAIKSKWSVEVRGKQDHASWRRAVSENLGIALDGIQPKPGHVWKECYPTFRGKTSPFDQTRSGQ